jgi:hypothetical protein
MKKIHTVAEASSPRVLSGGNLNDTLASANAPL